MLVVILVILHLSQGELELDKPKKISLKRDTVDTDSEEDARSKLSHKRRDGKSNLQVYFYQFIFVFF